MIYYFSGTGNSKWVAQKLSELTQDEAADILSLSTSLPLDVTGKRIGLVFPVYAWGLPEPMEKFIRCLTGKAVFSYGVCTCGADAGNAMEKPEEMVSRG